MSKIKLPIPEHFDSKKVGEVWKVPYQKLAESAKQYAQKYDIKSAKQDQTKICLLIIDAQNTFCMPEFELFVGGRSGTGAIDDNVRLCEFIYQNLDIITQIYPTMDTHTAMQIFHSIFWVNDQGNHPDPLTIISADDVQKGVWKVNPDISWSVDQGDYLTLQNHGLHYTEKLNLGNKYPLIIWPYHSILGGIGHALVSAVESALFFHCITRNSQTQFEIKGANPLTENYSVLRPEILEGVDKRPIAEKNTRLIQKLLDFDVVIIAGQAKSHCVAWTIDDLLTEIQAQNPDLAKKVYLLEDCTSAVVIPGIVDFTEQADQAFQRFADAGMHIVKSTTPIENWPNISLI